MGRRESVEETIRMMHWGAREEEMTCGWGGKSMGRNEMTWGVCERNARDSVLLVGIQEFCLGMLWKTN